MSTDKFSKAFEKKADTTSQKEPWQEHLERNPSVSASKSVEATEVLSGLSGSWAKFINRDPSAKNLSATIDAGIPGSHQEKITKLGQPGLPEINFAPYNWRTNRFGSKGPSFIGHPISFSIVGPTLKSPFTTWQWVLTDNSGTPGVGDTLAIDSVDIYGGTPISTTLAEAYNLTGSIADYNGGLYLVISQTGVRGLLDDGAGGTEIGGIGDGFIDTSAGRAAIDFRDPLNEDAKFEIFRVASFAGSTITLDPNKRIASFFTIPGGTPIVRAITLFQPYATRLVATPGSGAGVGREKTFVVVSPEQSANADFYPPYNGGTPSDGSWIQGGFEPVGAVGDSGSYGDQGRKLPIPTPLRTRKGRVHNTNSDGAAEDIGLWRIFDTESTADLSPDANKIIHITSVQKTGSVDLTYGDLTSLYGWFEVVSATGGAGGNWLLRRTVEVDPATGGLFYGPGPILGSASDEILVEFTVHDRVESIHLSSQYRIDDIEAARLTHLIDPTLVERTTKTDSVFAGTTPAKADRAIFDTHAGTNNANPGSLLDLGFRMVLFPAKLDAGGTLAVPDFDHPIDSREVIIDPAITMEKQFLDIDYSAGVVSLSHNPPATAGGHIIPNGIITGGGVTNNPRGEIILFAACVPFSMEEGQLGTGVRITGGTLGVASGGLGTGDQTDVFGARVSFPILGDTGGGPQVINSGSTTLQTITLSVDDGGLLPPSGFVEIVTGGAGAYGTPATTVTVANDRASTFGYYRKTTTTVGPDTVTVLEGVYGGGRTGTSISVVASGDYFIVLRRDVSTPNTLDGKAGTDYQFDTTYGFASRTSTFRFAYADFKYNIDGTITVTPTGMAGPAEELRSQFPLGTVSEKARFFFDPTTQKWTTSAPATASPDANEIGLEITRGRLISTLKHDFNSTVFDFHRYMTRGIRLRPVGATLSTPQKLFELELDPDPNALKGLTKYLGAPPTTLVSNYLCAVVEGSSVVSSEINTWPGFGGPDLLTPGSRVLVNIKEFGDRSQRDSTSKRILQVDEGPSNPVNWVAIESGPGNTLTSLVTDINAYYSTQGAEPASEFLADPFGPPDLARLMITERQVDILPSKPYLQSDVIPAPVTLVDGCRYAFTVYSADPKNDNVKKWVTLECTVAVDGIGTLSSSDANVIAAMLNRPLYDPTVGDARYMGDILDNAGFYATPTAVDPSPNPYLSTAYSPGLGEVPALGAVASERQFLWIGRNDPRHPDGTNSVCLICGGWGSSVLGGSERDFYNVMLETTLFDISTTILTEDVARTLGGDFIIGGGDFVSRCGLFFGTDATTTPGVPPFPADFVGPGADASHGLANIEAGFPFYGVLPLGAMVGSYPIKSAPGDPLLQIEMQSGETSYLKGPQVSPPPISGRVEDAYSQSNIGVYPYLGRWVWHGFERNVVDFGISSSIGIAHIHVAYGSHPHDETGFACYLTAPSSTLQRGYESFMVYATTGDAALQMPSVLQSAIKPGDQFIGNDPPGGSRDGSELAFEGIINGPLETSFFDPAEVALSFLCYRGQNYSRTVGFGAGSGHVYARHVQPLDLGLWSPLGNVEVTGKTVSIIANPNAFTEGAAGAFLYPNLYGRSTFQIGGSDDGSGIDGGATTSAQSIIPSGVLIGGGRVNLFSVFGASTPSGLVFSSPVVGSDAIKITSTFLEHGVFTSSLSLGNSLFGGSTQSAGIFDSFEREDNEAVGQFDGSDKVGGVAGIRISGDTQVWITNLRSLSSNNNTALVRLHLPYALEDNIADLTQWNMGTGPITILGKSKVQGVPFGHTPSGFGASRVSDDAPLHVQEATVEVGLTRLDYMAFMAATGNFNWPMNANDSTHQDVAWSEEESAGQSSLLLGQSAIDGDIPIPVRYLAGCYLKLDARNFTPINAASWDQPTNDTNAGIWRIVGTPMITQASHVSYLTGGGVDSSTTISLFSKKPNKTYYYPYGATGTDLLEPYDQEVGVGHGPNSTVVAVIQMRVERYAPMDDRIGVGEASNGFVYEVGINEANVGHPWGVYADHDASFPIYVADVVDPGGSPTGSPSSLRGLTINPASIGSGHTTLPMDLVGVFGGSANGTTTAWPLTGAGRLMGIHSTVDHRGREYSQAFFQMGTPGTPVSFLNNQRKSYGRLIVYSSQRDDRMDDFISSPTTAGEFIVDAAGRVQFAGHPKRLGLGVLIEGGLGMVQATAFRANPQSEVTDTIGSLSVYGHNAAYPLANHLNSRSQMGVSLPSTFNEVEFHGDTVIVSPSGGIHFEGSRAARGLTYNLKALVHAASFFRSPLQQALLRTEDNVNNIGFRSPVLPNDSLFPYTSDGIRMATPGGVIYERSFRPLDATGGGFGHVFSGNTDRHGIRGLEVPAFGEALLCPKGPPTIHGFGKSNFASSVGSVYGRTPLDRPLYEFTGAYLSNPPSGALDVVASPKFPIKPGTIFSSGSLVGADSDAGFKPHKSTPGNMAQSYRHTRSREDSISFIQESRESGVSGFVTPGITEQMRLLDGMVIENTDNGTFYTVGSVGRWKEYTYALRSITLTTVIALDSITIGISNTSVTYIADTDFAVGGSDTITAANLRDTINSDDIARKAGLFASSAANVVTIYGPLTFISGSGTFVSSAPSLLPSQVTLGLDQPGGDTATPSVFRRSSVNGSLVVGGGGYAYNIMWFGFDPTGDPMTVGDTFDLDYVDPYGVVHTNSFTAGTEFAIGATAVDSFNNLVSAINTMAPAAWAAFGFNTNNGYPVATLGDVFTDSGDDIYPLYLRIGNMGGDGNRWVISGTTFAVSPTGFQTLVVGQDFVGTPHSVFMSGSDHEVIYDLGPHTDVRVNPTLDEILPQERNGFGDRVDDGFVRRPLIGHNYRVTPNVEFVPVLGPRGVDGGLVPPVDSLSSINPNFIENADAIFYSRSYAFKSAARALGAGDIGRHLYICGTHNYVYTGWWVIINVLDDYSIPHSNTTTGGAESFSVAVLRKWRRGNLDRPGDFDTNDSALPLQYRSPLLRMSADTLTNEALDKGLFPNVLGPGAYSDLVLDITKSDGTVLYSHTEVEASLVGASVVDCTTLAVYANASADLNGANVPLSGIVPAGWIKWTSISNDHFSSGTSVEVTYDLSLLTDVQRSEVVGGLATLRIQFFSNVTGLHTSSDGKRAVGFYSYRGHNSQVDHGMGDRNNAHTIVSHPGAGSEYVADTAAYGVRWVFSSPLTEEHVGSFLHLMKPRIYRFGSDHLSQFTVDGVNPVSAKVAPVDEAWTSGYPRSGDSITQTTDIFRINRCPNTTDIVLGGDCEVYYPEIISVATNTTTGDNGLGRSVLYSPLSVQGNWPDTITGKLPDTLAHHQPLRYALQPIAREKIVTISPTHAKSNTLMGHGREYGAKGMGPLVGGNAPRVNDSDITASLAMHDPWQLFGKSNLNRTSSYLKERNEMELFNSNDPRTSLTSALIQNNYSTYSWTPSGEFWQMMIPDLHHTIRSPRIVLIDLPVDGNTFNLNGTIFTARNTPVGVTDFQISTLNDDEARRQDTMDSLATVINTAGIGVNATSIQQHSSIFDYSTPGYTPPTQESTPNTKNGGTPHTVVLEPHYSVISMFSSDPTKLQAVDVSLQYDASTPPPTLRVDLTEAFTQAMQPGGGMHSPYPGHAPKGVRLNRIWVNFGSWGKTLLGRSNANLPGWLESETSVFDNFTLLEPYMAFNLVVDLPGSQTRDVPKSVGYLDFVSNLAALDTITLGALTLTAVSPGPAAVNEFLVGVNSQATARNLALAINEYSSEVTAEDQSNSFSGRVYITAGDRGISGNSLFISSPVAPAKVTISGTILSSFPLTGGSDHPVGTGSSGQPFGDRAPTAAYTHGDNSSERFTGGSVVVPLYCNREAGDLMPNVMERFLTVGPRPIEATRIKTGTLPFRDAPSDWHLGDYEFGFGCSSAGVVNTFSDQFKPQYQDLYANIGGHGDALSSNAHNPVVWGGVDFDSANSGNFSYGVFKAPFTHSKYSRAMASVFPRLSRTGGGVRSDFTSGVVANGDMFKRSVITGTGQGPASLSAAAMTGIVVTHAGGLPLAPLSSAGSVLLEDQFVLTPNSGTTITSSFVPSPRSTGHAFTIALTPVGDGFNPPKSFAGGRESVDPSTLDTDLAGGDTQFQYYGRTLENPDSVLPSDRSFKVGNWLDKIIDRYGVAVPSGSMLPPGARVFLEITTNTGFGAISNDTSSILGLVSSGAWVGSIKCSFEVETADGVAYSNNVNILGSSKE